MTDTVGEPAPTESKTESRTPLGKRLRRIRAEIVASGEPLLSWDEVAREVAERRGGVEPEGS